MRFLPFVIVACASSAWAQSSPTSVPSQSGAEAGVARAAPAAGVQPATEEASAAKKVAHAKTALASQKYWDRCCEINRQFIAEKSGLWFKSVRPEAVGATSTKAATRLRSIETAEVDSEVIEHVNRVIRGFETIGAVVRLKGKESLERDAGDAAKFIYQYIPKPRFKGVADGGMLEMGIGLFAGGRQSSAAGLDRTARIADGLANSEEQVIRHMREKYKIELRPW